MITDEGPDTLTSCATDYGGILQLNAEYLAGVGGPCSYFNEWTRLVNYTEGDLNTLRNLAQLKETSQLKCGGQTTSLSMWSAIAMVAVGLGLSWI